MRVSLFVSCLVDQFWPSVGTATVELLRRAGCEVSFDPRQTCCSQPAFNTGYREEARRVARHFLSIYDPDDFDALVIPSGSCTAMIHHLPGLFDGDNEWQRKAQLVAERSHELASFLQEHVEIDSLSSSFQGRVSWHDACHGLRDLGIHSAPRALIGRLQDVELVEAEFCDSCCGFGGTFSVKYPEISEAMIDRKIEELERLELDAVVSGDVSCLMQIGGRLQRRNSSIRAMHLAELLVGEN